MKRVFTSADPVQAGLLHSVLEQAGIPCLLRNQYLAGALGDLPFNDCWPQLWVLHDADVRAALRLISERVPAVTVVLPGWECSVCREHLEGQFHQCWRCGAER